MILILKYPTSAAHLAAHISAPFLSHLVSRRPTPSLPLLFPISTPSDVAALAWKNSSSWWLGSSGMGAAPLVDSALKTWIRPSGAAMQNAETWIVVFCFPFFLIGGGMP